MKPQIKSFFDEDTFTITHVVVDPASKQAAIIDPVLDFDYAAGRTATRSADSLIEWVQSQSLEIQWILETHAHADHLTCAPYLKSRLGGRIGIGANITKVQAVFARLFNAEPEFH
ncbi:MAG: MBL fold metallo-hydrolase, partial [Xanthomonadales bacterium]|nr:MBL fold metallo-hydrolase [Xanthomonadales bacterium]